MKVFSDEEYPIFKIRINYKSGHSIEEWFDVFEYYDSHYKWNTDISPEQYENLKLIDDDSSVVISTEFLINNTSSRRVLKLGDDIESIVQLDTKVIKEFSTEFTEFIGEKLKHLLM